MCLFGKIDKNVQFNYLFSEIPKSFNLCPRKAGGFIILGLKKVVRLKQCSLYCFRFRDA